MKEHVELEVFDGDNSIPFDFSEIHTIDVFNKDLSMLLAKI